MFNFYSGNLNYNNKFKFYSSVGVVKENSIVEMLVDTQAGTLSYVVDGEDEGVAMQSDDFKTGEWYVTVALANPSNKFRLFNPSAVAESLQTALPVTVPNEVADLD